MTTYFGLCDSAGNPTNTDANNTGGTEVDWNGTQTFTCPGSGSQTITEITADVHQGVGGAYNIRCAVYDSTGATRIAQGAAAVAVVGASDTWQGHVGQANISPNPATLTGGTNYILAVAANGDLTSAHTKNGTTGIGKFDGTDETGGFPASLPAGSTAGAVFAVRVGLADAGDVLMAQVCL